MSARRQPLTHSLTPRSGFLRANPSCLHIHIRRWKSLQYNGGRPNTGRDQRCKQVVHRHVYLLIGAITAPHLSVSVTFKLFLCLKSGLPSSKLRIRFAPVLLIVVDCAFLSARAAQLVSWSEPISSPPPFLSVVLILPPTPTGQCCRSSLQGPVTTRYI